MRVLLAQLTPVAGAVDANVERLEAVLDGHDATLAVFPELFVCGNRPDDWGTAALDAGAEPIRAVAAAAARTRTAVVVGFAERDGDDVFNAALCVDADGTVAGIYRKTHLFGGDERAAFVPGSRLLVVELAGVAVAPLICFDVEFPEPARAAARAGARLLVTIAANFEPYADDHALATRARALDNRLPHVYVNRDGRHGAAAFTGGSRAIAAGGHVVASCDRGEQILVADLDVSHKRAPFDVDYLEHVRGDLPVLTAVAAPRP